MREKKPPHETPVDRLSGKPAAPLCRYEELAMRENRLRRERTEKSEPRG